MPGVVYENVKAPNSLSVLSNKALTLSSFETSVLTANTFALRDSSSSLAEFSFASFRAARTTLAPSLAKRREMSLPMPALAPVTIAICPQAYPSIIVYPPIGNQIFPNKGGLDKRLLSFDEIGTNRSFVGFHSQPRFFVNPNAPILNYSVAVLDDFAPNGHINCVHFQSDAPGY